MSQFPDILAPFVRWNGWPDRARGAHTTQYYDLDALAQHIEAQDYDLARLREAITLRVIDTSSVCKSEQLESVDIPDTIRVTDTGRNV